MKKNKRLAYALAVTLLVGGTFVGTKALFTDQEQVGGELRISTGDVDIKVTEDGKWEIDRNGEELAGETNYNGTGFTFDNVKPGDVLKKTITIENAGTLCALVSLEQTYNVGLGVLDGFLTLEETITGSEGWTSTDDLDEDQLWMLPGAQATIELTISANGLGLHNQKGSYNADEIEQAKVDLTNAWSLTATQQNPKNME